MAIACCGGDVVNPLEPGPADGFYPLWKIGGVPFAADAAVEGKDQITGYRNRPVYITTQDGPFTIASASLHLLTVLGAPSYTLTIVVCPGKLEVRETCDGEQIQSEWKGSHTVNPSDIVFSPSTVVTTREKGPILYPATWSAGWRPRQIVWTLEIQGTGEVLEAEFFEW